MTPSEQIERATRALIAAIKPKKLEQLSRSEQLRFMANLWSSIAGEVHSAYDDQIACRANFRLTKDDVVKLERLAAWSTHQADVWDWQQDPLVAQRMRSGLPVEGVDGLPKRPPSPACERPRPTDTPRDFPATISRSWSEMVIEFLGNRRGVA